MKSVNVTLMDEAIRHAIDLQFFANGAVQRIVAFLNASDKTLFATLASAIADIPPGMVTAPKIASAIASSAVINRRAYRAVEAAILREVDLLARYETEYQFAMFKTILPAVGDISAVSWEAVLAAAIARPFQGRLLSEWAAGMPDSRLRRIQDAVNIGFVEGKTTEEIVRKLKGTKAADYSDGIVNADRSSLEAVTRTALSHTASVARERFYAANTDLIKAKVWVSTLDTRTTPACQVRDGLQYTLDDTPIGHAVPWLSGPGQLHWNCRSSSTPVIAHWQELGLDPTIGERATMDGTVPAATAFGSWIRRQSAARQDEVLGPTRALLMRKGGMTFDAMFSNKGTRFTLDELRERDAVAFNRAGL